MKYKIEKVGSVRVRGTPDSACGSERNGRKFDWIVTVETNRLDDRNFVVEHLDITDGIAKFFKENKITGSCEQVARQAGKVVSELFKLNSVTDPYLTIEFIGSATITIDGPASAFRAFDSIAARPIPASVPADKVTEKTKPMNESVVRQQDALVSSRGC